MYEAFAIGTARAEMFNVARNLLETLDQRELPMSLYLFNSLISAVKFKWDSRSLPFVYHIFDVAQRQYVLSFFFLSISLSLTDSHTIHTHTHTLSHTIIHTHTHTYTLAHPHTHTYTCTYTHILCLVSSPSSCLFSTILLVCLVVSRCIYLTVRLHFSLSCVSIRCVFSAGALNLNHTHQSHGLAYAGSFGLFLQRRIAGCDLPRRGW
jgi:hypothetical protein